MTFECVSLICVSLKWGTCDELNVVFIIIFEQPTEKAIFSRLFDYQQCCTGSQLPDSRPFAGRFYVASTGKPTIGDCGAK
jgi:hypothetical protein